MAFTGIAAGVSLVMAASPMIGEMVATMSPISLTYPRKYMNLEHEDVEFPTTDGLTLRGWFFPASDRHAPAVIYAPATAKDQRQGLSLVKPLLKAGYQVLLFSYRGSGSSDGDRLGFSYGARESLDIDAAVRYLSETRGILRIGAIGHSAGAVSIILSAARNTKIDAVIVAAPFTSLQDIWQDNRPVYFPNELFIQSQRIFQLRKEFSKSQVRPIDVIAQISPRPILMINGMMDQRIPKEQASRLFEAASFPKQIIWLPNASHAEVRSPGLDNLAPQIVDFLDKSLRGKAVNS
jgi:alpha-beta hydrolase superfamily lysophospholipase